jgi:glycosyltransferase involved in cell wall biosynthesis
MAVTTQPSGIAKTTRKQSDARQSDGAPNVLTGRDIICFANDWAADPLSKKHVMTRLARHNRILWVNSLHNRRPQLAKKDAHRIAQKLLEFVRGIRPAQANIWQLTPLYLPFLGSPWVRRFNRALLRIQLHHALRQLRFRNYITWTFSPSSAEVAGCLGERFVLYHCVDEYAAFSDADQEIEAAECRLLKRADLVLASSEPLLEKKQALNAETYLALHGVDYEHFHQAVEASTPVAPELRSLPRPVLGFHGLLADWVDFKLIAQVARSRPEWSIVLVGRADTDLACLRNLPNVHLVGHRPYELLPTYLKGFDVALLPFVRNELTRNANPLKLREYLAAGLPVVAAPLPEIARFSGLAELASTPEEYVSQVESILARGSAGPCAHRSDKIAGESWERKLAEMETVVAMALSKKQGSEPIAHWPGRTAYPSPVQSESD